MRPDKRLPETGHSLGLPAPTGRQPHLPRRSGDSVFQPSLLHPGPDAAVSTGLCARLTRPDLPALDDPPPTAVPHPAPASTPLSPSSAPHGLARDPWEVVPSSTCSHVPVPGGAQATALTVIHVAPCEGPGCGFAFRTQSFAHRGPSRCSSGPQSTLQPQGLCTGRGPRAHSMAPRRPAPLRPLPSPSVVRGAFPSPVTGRSHTHPVWSLLTPRLRGFSVAHVRVSVRCLLPTST